MEQYFPNFLELALHLGVVSVVTEGRTMYQCRIGANYWWQAVREK